MIDHSEISTEKYRIPLSKSQSANFKSETSCKNQYLNLSLKNRSEDIENKLEKHQIDKMNSTIMMVNKAKQITSNLAAHTIASSNKQASRRKLI